VKLDKKTKITETTYSCTANPSQIEQVEFELHVKTEALKMSKDGSENHQISSSWNKINTATHYICKNTSCNVKSPIEVACLMGLPPLDVEISFLGRVSQCSVFVAFLLMY
jgi:hypothetical protein